MLKSIPNSHQNVKTYTQFRFGLQIWFIRILFFVNEITSLVSNVKKQQLIKA